MVVDYELGKYARNGIGMFEGTIPEYAQRD
jgi:hypothetical protein